ncbi:MAG: carbohydrate binding family 9 domain-containing protein, partial [Gemmatimonadetes bacterium]|nr:carbohydrate binding family 9 domain-containing protein [Gemmatimonadota bacterium]
MYDRISPRMVLLAAALLAARPAAAQELASSGAQQPAARTAAGSPQRVLRAAAATQIHVDGKLDEPAWANATPATDFVQQSPNDGRPATERTEARVLFDGEAIYVGMRMYDPHPDSILAQLTRRDQGSESDGARVFIDSYNDKRTAFVFGLNPRGVKDDFLRYNDGEGIDSDWDAVWDGAAHVDSLGWTAEFRIPLSQIRFNAAQVNAGGNWGLNFRRYLSRRGEVDFWAPISANSNAFVSLFGELQGLHGLRQAHRLEVMPYVSSKLDHLPTADRNAFTGASNFAGGVGADLKAGLPGGLTLSATINPDFGQVEVDPAVVNLSAFETFFPERRPFFVEGADIFQFGNLNTFNSYGFTQFFYSRRIGRQPQGAIRVDNATDLHSPDATTILGAAKVSGKIGGWSLGVMDALTNRESGDFRTSAGLEGRYPVEPLTNYFVGRVRRDFNQGATVIGGMVTGVGRDLRGNEFDPYLRSRAAMFGVDGSHSWGNRDWTLSGYLAGTRVSGSADAIARTQRAAAHYYNRPDADYLTYDPTRTSLDGHDAGLSLSHSGSWDASATYVEVSPGFETNDVGFMNRGDYRAFSTFLGRRMNKPTGPFRNRTMFIYHNAAWNFGGDAIYNGIGTGLQAGWKNLWYTSLRGTVSFDRWDDRATRGGPAIRRAGGWSLGL